MSTTNQPNDRRRILKGYLEGFADELSEKFPKELDRDELQKLIDETMANVDPLDVGE